MATVTESDVIKGVYLVDPVVHGDDRGYFVETYRRPRSSRSRGESCGTVSARSPLNTSAGAGRWRTAC